MWYIHEIGHLHLHPLWAYMNIEQTGDNLTFEGCGFENSCAIHESGFQLRLKIK